MKRIMILLALVLAGISNGHSQQDQDINELLERLQQNHSTGITDVFTSEEIDLLRTHFDAQGEATDLPTVESVGIELFAPENVSMSFGHFHNSDPGNFNILSPSGTANFEGAGAFNPVSGTYFVTDNAGNVYDVDPDTGIYTFLGNIMAPNGENYVGLEYDVTDDQMYGLSTDGLGSTSLSTINVNTLSVSFKGNTGLTLGIAYATDLSGNGYAIDIDADLSYRINKTNGVATLLGSIGYDANFGQGFGLSRSTGNLYVSAFNNTILNSELRHFDTTTGNTTSMGLIGNITPGGGARQFGWLGVWDFELGTTDQSFENFTYGPNPVADRLMVEASSPIQSIEIYDILGQKVYEKQIEQVIAGLDLQALSSGTYIMSVSINGGRSSYKLLKQ